MKTTVFELVNPKVDREDSVLCPKETIFKIPTLPAYSIIDHSLDSGNYSQFESGSYQTMYSIEDDCIRIQGVKSELAPSIKDRLIVHYAGIRDYSLLFPSIEDPVRRQRLGQYAEESEKSIDIGSWMSFIVMSGAVIEGLLGNFTKAYRFSGMIKSNKILTDKEAQLCIEIKDARNRIHAGEFNSPAVDRALAMDTYLIYDRLIKRHWPVPTELKGLGSEKILETKKDSIQL